MINDYKFYILIKVIKLGIGDWGLGIGDWAIPNPQSPIPNFTIIFIIIIT